MFICTTCLETKTENFGVPHSHGKCEICDKTDLCVDIHHRDIELKPTFEPEQKVNEPRGAKFMNDAKYIVDDLFDCSSENIERLFNLSLA